MERHEPHDPRATEPGDHPPNAERKGNWKVAAVSVGLAFVVVMIIGFGFGWIY
jgi:hypothetical protein